MPKIKNKIEKIQRRNGSIVDFDQKKITEALFKALTASGQGDGVKSKRLSNKVVQILNRRFKKEEMPQIEQIQDIVEEVLILEEYVETAKAYILYREQRRRIRESTQVVDESSEKIDSYLQEIDWQVSENANMTFSLQGLNQYVGSYISKKYWLNKIYPQEIREAAAKEDFHIHNLELLAPYCAGWDLYDFLKRGFGGVTGKIECSPPKHLRTALGQLVNILYTLQGETAGANAVSNFDTLLAPFIRYDNLNYKQLKQVMQEFLYSCMVPTRVGFQTPFLNVSLDIKPPSFLASQPVIVGGQSQKETYGEFQPEMDMFIKAFYEGLIEGDAKGRPFTFPIPTVSITKDFEWDNPNLSALWDATAKYGINYFSNFIHSDMNPEDFRSMCVTPDTQIIYKNTLGNIGKMPIRRIVEDFIKSGNLGEVLMNGEFVKIKNVLRLTNKAGYVLKITLENGETFRITPDHPSMVIKENKLVEVRSEKLKTGDEIPIAKNSYKGELGDFDLGRFVGLYAAEGYLAHNEATTAFSFCSKEKDYFDFITKLAQKRFGAKTTIKIEEKHQSLVAVINDRAVGALVKSYVRGDNSLNKMFSSKLFGMSHEFRKGVLAGILEGDGHISKIDSTRNIQINSSNSGLIDDVGLLCRSLGVNYTKQINFNNTHFGMRFTSYKLLLTNDFPGWLAEYFNRKLGKSRIYKDYKNFYGLKIKSIERIPYADQVYDFETENKEHLFQLANGVITHNCCRLRLNNKELYMRGGGLFGSQPLTGSIGVVTINMPRIGYLSKTKKEFLKRLSHLMDLAKESLEIKRKALDNLIEKGLYPYSKHYLEGVKKLRNSYFGNHFSTIGLIGMNEALLNFLGEDIGTVRGRKFAAEILGFMREKLVKFQEKTGNIYNLEATPGEGTSYRQAKSDKEKYPDIITAGTKEVPYYTNSTHLPVNYTDDIFQALRCQDELQTKYNGGTVLHLFLGEKISDSETAKNLVRKIFEKYHLPYITLTPTFSICPSHGYLAGEHFECPKCIVKQPCEVYSRVVGYIRPVQQWHKGKRQEYEERKEYKIPVS
ncbi:hypothetical protein KKC00_02565 [Patescibacteria group bacterium]|nr:hypothetical protein [Patescibacteria group bacterium]